MVVLFLYPRRLYCYKGVVDSIQQMLLRPGFLQSCEKWRERCDPENGIEDVYDGRIWKEFIIHENQPFLSVPFNFALSLSFNHSSALTIMLVQFILQFKIYPEKNAS